MIQEQVTAINGNIVYTASGANRCIGSRPVAVGDYVWTESGCVFGNESTGPQVVYVPTTDPDVIMQIVAQTVNGKFVYYAALVNVKDPTKYELIDAIGYKETRPHIYDGQKQGGITMDGNTVSVAYGDGTTGTITLPEQTGYWLVDAKIVDDVPVFIVAYDYTDSSGIYWQQYAVYRGGECIHTVDTSQQAAEPGEDAQADYSDALAAVIKAWNPAQAWDSNIDYYGNWTMFCTYNNYLWQATEEIPAGVAPGTDARWLQICATTDMYVPVGALTCDPQGSWGSYSWGSSYVAGCVDYDGSYNIVFTVGGSSWRDTLDIYDNGTKIGSFAGGLYNGTDGYSMPGGQRVNYYRAHGGAVSKLLSTRNRADYGSTQSHEGGNCITTLGGKIANIDIGVSTTTGTAHTPPANYCELGYEYQQVDGGMQLRKGGTVVTEEVFIVEPRIFAETDKYLLGRSRWSGVSHLSLFCIDKTSGAVTSILPTDYTPNYTEGTTIKSSKAKKYAKQLTDGYF